MAPPPLPADYGSSGGGGGGGWDAPAPPAAAPMASTAPNDDWGWDAPAPPPAQENNAPRYSNAPADDPWGNDDNNYNQAGSSNDPFDPFDHPPSQQQPQMQQHTTTATANTNQVTFMSHSKKDYVCLLYSTHLGKNPYFIDFIQKFTFLKSQFFTKFSL